MINWKRFSICRLSGIKSMKVSTGCVNWGGSSGKTSPFMGVSSPYTLGWGIFTRIAISAQPIIYMATIKTSKSSCCPRTLAGYHASPPSKNREMIHPPRDLLISHTNWVRLIPLKKKKKKSHSGIKVGRIRVERCGPLTSVTRRCRIIRLSKKKQHFKKKWTS